MKNHTQKLFLIIFFLSIPKTMLSQENTILTEIFRNSYNVFERMRDPNTGIYQAKANLDNNNDLSESSIAVDGMGLITVCIADKMGWISNGQALVIKTLESLSGNTAGFVPDRNPSGYFPHFFNKSTGERGANGTSEYSTVDNAVFMSGVRFCKNYFSTHSNGPTITALADNLLTSIDWSESVVDPATDPNGGGLYLAINDDGTGLGNNITRPYNEYILVAWLAYNQEIENNVVGPAHNFWNSWYANTSSLYKVNYGGYDILTVMNHNFQAEHTFQMPYFLCNYYTTDKGGDVNGNFGYLHYMENIKNADKIWFQNTDLADNTITIQPYEWAMSAGSGINPATGDLNEGYYSVDKINDNPFVFVSPHTIAGFIPINPGSKNDLVSLFNNNKGVYELPWNTSKKIVWRYSIKEPTWTAPKIQGVDFAPLVFGIAALPEYCGNTFFSTYNDFDYAVLSVENADYSDLISVYPNPTENQEVTVTINFKDQKLTQIKMYDVLGKVVYSKEIKGDITAFNEMIKLPSLKSGLYFMQFHTNKSSFVKHILVNK